MRNLYQGENQARAIATAAFTANYGHPAWDAGPVTPTVTFSIDTTTGQRALNITASSTINTFFIRLLPQWRTLQVNAYAQTTRARLIMSLSLDNSYSMQLNGGAAALPGAVTQFINYFDDTFDTVGMVDFAAAVTNQIAIARPFKTSIINGVNNLINMGTYTFSVGGLTNAYAQIVSVPTNVNENVVKVCVFFTDGQANTIQDTFRLSTNLPPKFTLLNYRGPSQITDFFNPTNGNPWTFSGINKVPKLFYSHTLGSTQSISTAKVTADAETRCYEIANAMRASGIFVYCIGLGNKDIDETFLQQVANDPNVHGYVPTAYDGVAVIAPSAAELKQAFDLIASKVLLRLSQ